MSQTCTLQFCCIVKSCCATNAIKKPVCNGKFKDCQNIRNNSTAFPLCVYMVDFAKFNMKCAVEKFFYLHAKARGTLVFHLPLVKSGTSTVLLLLATDCAVKGTMTLLVTES